jgi:hypothetical protein
MPEKSVNNAPNKIVGVPFAMSWTRDDMAARAAQELRDGYYVNLGIPYKIYIP